MWKAFSPESWAALLSGLTRLKGAADDNKSAVSGLGADFAELSRLTAESIAGKQDKPIKSSTTISTTGWGSDSMADYPKYYDIAMAGVTANDRARVDVAPASAWTAARCGLCPGCETLAGKIRIRAASVPEASMDVDYKVEKGD